MTADRQNEKRACYAVIFSSVRKNEHHGYDETAAAMETLARTMPGYLGHEAARGSDGFGITVSYWESEDAIANWKRHADHLAAQQRGRKDWYSDYMVRVARVTRSYGMKRA